MADFLKGSFKAIVAGLAAAIAFAIPVVDDGLKPSEGLGIAGAFLTAYIATYFVKNRGPKAPVPDNSVVPEGDREPRLF